MAVAWCVSLVLAGGLWVVMREADSHAGSQADSGTLVITPGRSTVAPGATISLMTVRRFADGSTREVGGARWSST